VRGNRHRLLTFGVLAGTAALLGAGFPVEDVAKDVPPEKWAGSVCRGLSDWGEELGAASTSFPEAESRKEATGILEDAVDATAALVKDLQKAGIPDVDGGRATARQFLAAFKDAKKLLEGATEDAGDLPKGDDFEDALGNVDDDLGEGFDSIGEDVESARSDADPELQAALAEKPDCSGIFADDTGSDGTGGDQETDGDLP
jgi:hypothetical protein